MNTPEHGRAIRVNRVPVLTLWATVVAERLGFDHDVALTLGRAVAGTSAQMNRASAGYLRAFRGAPVQSGRGAPGIPQAR